MTAYIEERRVTVYVRAAEGAGVTDVPECWFARCACVCVCVCAYLLPQHYGSLLSSFVR
jgi:hypothetical protein